MVTKQRYISSVLNVICLMNERFSFEQDFLANIILMCSIGFKSVNFLLNKAPYLRRSYFKKISSVSKDQTQRCLGCNKNAASTSYSSSSKMSDDTVAVYLENKASTVKKTKKQPNYFVAVQVTDQEVHSSVKLIQDHILLQNEKLAKSMVARSTLHITLMVMHIKDTDEHSKAIKALSAVHQEWNNIISKKPLRLEFCGVGDFQNRVLYAKLKKNESYHLLCDLAKSVCAHFGMVGLFSTDKRKESTFHLTIAKINFSEKSSMKIKKFNPLWYEDFTDLYIGCDTVRSIQLLKMHGPKTTLGYYSGDELIFCFNDKIVWKKLNALLAIADKKKEIRNRISEITKKLLK